MVLREKGPTLVGVLWMETVICLIVLGLRVYTRVRILRNPGWDDLLLVITWFLMVAFAGLCTGSAAYGMGVHAEFLSQHETSRAMLLLLSGQSVVAIAMGISKFAVGVFLLRIVVSKWHKAFLWFWNISIMVLSILLAITVFAQCTPVQSIWDTRIPKDSCPLSLTVIATVMCAWSAALDFVLALFPWYALWGLNMKRKEKITICASLSLGIFAGVCGVIRTRTLDSLSQSTEYLYATTDSVIWTNSELTTTIVCVSVPALRPLYRSIRGLASSKDASNYNNLGGSYGKSSANRSRQPSYGMDTLISSRIQGDDGQDCVVTSNGKTVEIDDGDDIDTRRILPRNRDTAQNIYQVKEVIVSYEDRRNGEGSVGESMPPPPVRARQHI
ncbi:uncharacterized protein APUU_50068S [Aspergillus puulaauensis]|uniref:Rhodopsin domain-containing protein n=1 Tax=Aspergillus puulaauensis TaxID=1220207 RepID=A0A7R7XPI8_9EURO|nr:uncharacterized protein APUU_50068S [Aspergillus puulaauensis]BCS25357.1 hypothetical protein APUU_50068S [Aspergillus puulaauensis]